MQDELKFKRAIEFYFYFYLDPEMFSWRFNSLRRKREATDHGS